MRIAVITGNPKPGSRTQGVALAVADTLAAELDPSSPPASTGPASTGPASTGPASTGPASTGPASTGPAHLLAVEVHLRPVLVELGATVPARGLYVTEPEFATLDAAIAAWAKTAVPLIRRALNPG
jgi:NAD(P)H-dependent FMN reductase